MAAKKSVQERQKQKQAKQKKLLMLLIPVLLIAAGLQLPKLLGGSDEPEASSTDAAETAPSDSRPTGWRSRWRRHWR